MTLFSYVIRLKNNLDKLNYVIRLKNKLDKPPP